ncbi:ABC transporter ATP-binding protein [Proteobacteria bacterium 005FR1]|nr:ABC transporter ATP-binding protein [Proteobacteria bacterium 005FR1]
MAEIHLKNIAHSYRENPQSPADYALKPCDYFWQDGGAYALLGPSGCGKSTLLNIISGLLQPSEGQILLDGRDVTRSSIQDRNIAQVFQFPVIYDSMTVYDNLAFPLRNRGVEATAVKQRVREVAEMLDLGDILHSRARGLSPDAKQTISLGRALVRNDVAAILFDEPLTVIDPHLKFLLRRKLKQVHERHQLTLIYVTHDQSEALTFADQVVVMNEGQILQVGSPQELFEKPAHSFVGHFIGSPGMNFFDCELVDGHALIGSQKLRIHHGGCAQPAERTQIGIRPEFLRLSDSAGDHSLPVMVESVQDLGNYQIASGQLEGRPVKIKLDEEQAVGTGPAHLHFAPEHTRIYLDDWLCEAKP